MRSWVRRQIAGPCWLGPYLKGRFECRAGRCGLKSAFFRPYRTHFGDRRELTSALTLEPAAPFLDEPLAVEAGVPVRFRLQSMDRTSWRDLIGQFS